MVTFLLITGTAPAVGQVTPANPCAPTPATATLASKTNITGVISLHFFFAQAAVVTYYECLRGRAYELGRRQNPTGGAITSFPVATYWRCGRVERHFAATATLPDGSFARGTTGVRTMSCAQRFSLDAVPRAKRGNRVRVQIADAWGIGRIRPRLCVTSPGGIRNCRLVVFPRSAKLATRHFRASTRGRWRIELRVLQHRVRATVAVGVPAIVQRKVRPALLATGDSTMQGIESFLGDELGDAVQFASDVRPGFAIGKDDGWAPIATAQVERLRPVQTVISIGANEGFPMYAPTGLEHPCCEEPWVAEYARRVRKIMVTYLRGGRGRVYWLTIPAPKDPRSVRIFNAVNAGILRAAEGVAGVRVLRFDTLFSPNGYVEKIRYKGRDVEVREPDGIHLNVAGTKIAAQVVEQALREG